jgi:hypothetical protein
MVHLKTLPALQELDLLITHVTDAGLAQLGQLRSLQRLYLGDWVSYPDDPDERIITDAGLKHLYSLSNLRLVYLKHTLVTREGIAHLQKALPTTEITSPETP